MFKCKNIRYRERGVTLVELLIVISIAGILASLALPSYRNMIISNKISTLTSELHGNLLLARSEALKRGINVSVCKSSNADSVAAACDISQSEAGVNIGWASGWLIFADLNGNCSLDNGEPLIRAQGMMLSNPQDGAIVPSNGAECLSFGVMGQTFNAVNFQVSAPAGFASLERAVCVAIGGRARVGKAPACV